MGWVHQAVRTLRSGHGFSDLPTSGPVTSSTAGGYACWWCDTRTAEAGSDWREFHRAYLVRLRGLLASALDLHHCNLIEASLAACEVRLDAMTTVWGLRTGHGDFHFHNVIVNGTTVTGVIDWEWGGSTEPDADPAHLLRWSLSPAHPADDDLEDYGTAADFAGVPSAIWRAYPEVAAMKCLVARLFVYLVEHDLHQLTQYPGSQQAIFRLNAWLAGAHLTLLPGNWWNRGNNSVGQVTIPKEVTGPTTVQRQTVVLTGLP